MFNVGVLTISDKGYKKEREDKSGKVIIQILEDYGYVVKEYDIVPDEIDMIVEKLKYYSDDLSLDLVLTTGGTGFSKRDVTPEATEKVIEKNANGIAEAIRNFSLSITDRAMLSRAVSGIRNETLIINLPGSPKACIESLEYALDSINHGLEILTGRDFECAR
ncbi:MAG TPA: MogA/MoaB family molybdenum cofactor biosynthesis protein [Tissierellaceae bacterium]